jgi:hypothetical protein
MLSGRIEVRIVKILQVTIFTAMLVEYRLTTVGNFESFEDELEWPKVRSELNVYFSGFYTWPPLIIR